MRVLVLVGGQPGSGKTTFGEAVVEMGNRSSEPWCHISVGDKLREKFKNSQGTESNLLARSQILNDLCVHELILEQIQVIPSINNVVLSGFPRHVGQLTFLMKICEEFQTTILTRLDCSNLTAMKRIRSRAPRQGENLFSRRRENRRAHEYREITAPALYAASNLVDYSINFDVDQVAPKELAQTFWALLHDESA